MSSNIFCPTKDNQSDEEKQQSLTTVISEINLVSQIKVFYRIDRTALFSLKSPRLFSFPNVLFFVVVFQADVARARPSGILRVFPRLGGRGSCRDGLQTLLRPGLVMRHLLLLDQRQWWTQTTRFVESLKHQLHSQENSSDLWKANVGIFCSSLSLLWDYM